MKNSVRFDTRIQLRNCDLSQGIGYCPEFPHTPLQSIHIPSPLLPTGPAASGSHCMACSFLFCFILFLFLLFIYLCIQQVLISYQFYTHQCIHVNPNRPIQHTTIPTPLQLSPLGVHAFVLYICVSISALKTGSSVPFF